MMESAQYRLTVPGDEPALKEIWLQAYQDDPVYLETFFQQFYRPGTGVVAEVDGTLCSAIYLMEGFFYRPPHQPPLSCTYLYALGTPPCHRGKGYGGRTIWHSGVEGYRNGADLVCFLPASPSLAQWYGAILGTRTAFWYRRFSISGGRPWLGLTLTPCSPAQYHTLREFLLQDTPHTDIPLDALGLQNTFCRQGDGGLYQLTAPDGTCAAVTFDREGAVLTVRELLAPQSDPTALVQGLLHLVDGTTAEVRTPTFWHRELGEIVPCSVLIPGGFSFHPHPDAYWGLALD